MYGGARLWGGVLAGYDIFLTAVPAPALTAVAKIRTSAQLRLVSERAPLQLSMSIATPDGYHTRWSTVETSSLKAHQGLTFSTTMPGGFEHADVTLIRDPRRSFPDLDELSMVTIYSAGGSVVWQGRLETIPSVSGDQVSLTPGMSGYQGVLTDNNAVREIYVESNLNSWQGPSLDRQVFLASPSVLVDFDTGSVAGDPYRSDTPNLPAMILSFSSNWARSHFAEAWYDTQGIPIGYVIYDAQLSATNQLATPLTSGGAVPTNGTVTGGGWAFNMVLTNHDDDSSGSFHDVDNFTGQGPTWTHRQFNASSGDRIFAYAQLAFSGAGGQSGATYNLFFPKLQVFGRSGVPIYYDDPAVPTNAGTGLYGVLGSDVIKHAVPKYASQVAITAQGLSTINPSTFVIPELIQLQNGTVADIIKAVTAFELEDWAVWSGDFGRPTLYWYPRGQFTWPSPARKWRARITPSKLQSAGPQIDRLWNGVIVSFTDFAGIQRSVGPPGSGCPLTDSSLADPDPLNPLNHLIDPATGQPRPKWAPLAMQTATATVAVKVGKIFLQEQKLLSTAGSAQLSGTVEDEHGVNWPAWKPRAGDYISFVDAADTSYRRIVSSSYSDDARVNSITLDTPPDTLQAILSRLQTTLVPITGG